MSSNLPKTIYVIMKSECKSSGLILLIPFETIPQVKLISSCNTVGYIVNEKIGYIVSYDGQKKIPTHLYCLQCMPI